MKNYTLKEMIQSYVEYHNKLCWDYKIKRNMNELNKDIKRLEKIVKESKTLNIKINLS